MAAKRVFSAFVAHGFDQVGRVIARKTKIKLRQAGVKLTTGDSPGLGPIADKVKRMINEADAFVAILHRREQPQSSRWVDQEIGFAMGRNKPILLLVEEGLDIEGIQGDLEYIPFTYMKNAVTIGAGRLREYVRQAALRLHEQKFGQFLPDAVYSTAKSIAFNAVIANATREIFAVGLGMQPIVDTCDRDIFRRLADNRSLKVTIVLSDPRAMTSRLRAEDEGDEPENLVRDVAKIAIRYLGNKELQGDLSSGRLVFRFTKVYPTVAVAVFDDDLYVYFYGYRHRGTESPVLLFRNYQKNPSAKFFTSHMNHLIQGAGEIPIQELRTIQRGRNPIPPPRKSVSSRPAERRWPKFANMRKIHE